MIKRSGRNRRSGETQWLRGRTYKISACAVLTALAMIFSYIEAMIPFSLGIPGIKLGLSNLVVLVALYGIGASYAFGINLTRWSICCSFFKCRLHSFAHSLRHNSQFFGLFHPVASVTSRFHCLRLRESNF